MGANDFVHEFNNLLTAIISNLSIARVDSSPESDLDNILLEAESAAHEARVDGNNSFYQMIQPLRGNLTKKFNLTSRIHFLVIEECLLSMMTSEPELLCAKCLSI